EVVSGAAVEPDVRAAGDLYAECLRLAREAGDRILAAQALTRLGMVAREQGDPVGARPLLEESLATFRALGDRFHVAWAARNLGNVAADLGDAALARARYAEALTIEGEFGYGLGVAEALEKLAGLDAAAGRPARALRLAGAAAPLRGAFGRRRWPLDQAQLERWVQTARAALGEPAAAAAWAAGQAMSLDQAVAYALEDAPGADAGPYPPCPTPGEPP